MLAVVRLNRSTPFNVLVVSRNSTSPLVAPIIPVINNDGSIRICGDYKEILNQITSCVKYPIQKAGGSLAMLNLGKNLPN